MRHRGLGDGRRDGRRFPTVDRWRRNAGKRRQAGRCGAGQRGEENIGTRILQGFDVTGDDRQRFLLDATTRRAGQAFAMKNWQDAVRLAMRDLTLRKPHRNLDKRRKGFGRTIPPTRNSYFSVAANGFLAESQARLAAIR